MKEFRAQTGGRHTFADDILNLQDLALAFSQIFSECEGFILSGCEVINDSITPGYVYLNGKIRQFSGAANLTQWPQYIYEADVSENVTYESGSEQVGREIYGCAIGTTVPVTDTAPAFIAISQTGGIRMQQAFIGKYAVLHNALGSQSQEINGSIRVSKDIVAGGAISASRQTIANGNARLEVTVSKENSSISCIFNDKKYELKINKLAGFDFLVDDQLVFEIAADSIRYNFPMMGKRCAVGSMELKDTDIYNSTAVDGGIVNINMAGYQGGYKFFKNTCIGNGKGKAVLSVIGKNSHVIISGTSTIKSDVTSALTLQSVYPKTDNRYTKAIRWADSNLEDMAHMGFTSYEDQHFRLINDVGSILLHANGIVDIYPAIAEGGVRLDSKYVQKTEMTKYLTVANQLSDVIRKEEDKAVVCKNIGAATQKEVDEKTKDSGWITLAKGFHVRQIGKVVSIQGTTKTIHNHTGVISFDKLPEQIDAPAYDVLTTICVDKESEWTLRIDANSHEIKSVHCLGGTGKPASFSLTYMTI